MPEYNDVNELLERHEDEIVGGLEEHQENQATGEVSDAVIVGKSSVNNVVNVDNKESTSSVTELFKNKDLTMKKDIRWKINVTYLTPSIPCYKKMLNMLRWKVLYILKIYIFEDMTKYTKFYAIQQHSKFKGTEVEYFVNIEEGDPQNTDRFFKVRPLFDAI